MARLCGNCKQTGHYASTCKNVKVENPNVLPPPATVQGNAAKVEAKIEAPAPTLPLPTPSPAAMARGFERLRQATNEATAAQAVADAQESLEPRKGLWVVSTTRKRIAGKILQVKSGGEVLYENMFGAHMESPPQKILDSGYAFVELEPRMLLWLGKESNGDHL